MMPQPIHLVAAEGFRVDRVGPRSPQALANLLERAKRQWWAGRPPEAREPRQFRRAEYLLVTRRYELLFREGLFDWLKETAAGGPQA